MRIIARFGIALLALPVLGVAAACLAAEPVSCGATISDNLKTAEHNLQSSTSDHQALLCLVQAMRKMNEETPLKERVNGIKAIAVPVTEQRPQ